MVFVSYNKSTFISIYMDDLFIINRELNIINNLKNKLLEYFCMTNLKSVSYYLGISVTQLRDFVSWNQKTYIERILL